MRAFARVLARPAVNTRVVVRRQFSESTSALSFSFSAPHSVLYHQSPVESVILPGINGEYGVSKGHVSLVEQLKAGVVKVVQTSGEAPISYFISGGFAFTDEEKTEVTATEAIMVEDIEPSKVEAEFKKYSAEFAA